MAQGTARTVNSFFGSLDLSCAWTAQGEVADKRPLADVLVSAKQRARATGLVEMRKQTLQPLFGAATAVGPSADPGRDDCDVARLRAGRVRRKSLIDGSEDR